MKHLTIYVGKNRREAVNIFSECVLRENRRVAAKILGDVEILDQNGDVELFST